MPPKKSFEELTRTLPTDLNKEIRSYINSYVSFQVFLDEERKKLGKALGLNLFKKPNQKKDIQYYILPAERDPSVHPWAHLSRVGTFLFPLPRDLNLNEEAMDIVQSALLDIYHHYSDIERVEEFDDAVRLAINQNRYEYLDYSFNQYRRRGVRRYDANSYSDSDEE